MSSIFSFPVILPIAVFLFVLYFNRKNNNKFEGLFLFPVFFAFVSVCITVFIGIVVNSMKLEKFSTSEYDQVRIVALSTSSATEGAFFLGSGHFSGEIRYVFYFETPDGGKKLTSLPAEFVTLYEEDRKDAFMAKLVEKQSFGRRSSLSEFFAPSFLLSTKGRYAGYVIRIPKGSIKEGINLDLPK